MHNPSAPFKMRNHAIEKNSYEREKITVKTNCSYTATTLCRSKYESEGSDVFDPSRIFIWSKTEIFKKKVKVTLLLDSWAENYVGTVKNSIHCSYSHLSIILLVSKYFISFMMNLLVTSYISNVDITASHGSIDIIGVKKID